MNMDPSTTTLLPQRRDWIAPAAALVLGLAVIGVIAQVSFLGAGLLYAVFFLGLAWTRPELALMMIFALAPFQQDLSIGGPFKFSISEINLALAAAALGFQHLAGRRPLRLGLLLGPVVLYLLICFISTMLNWRDMAAVKSLLQMVLYMIVAVAVFASMIDRREQLLPALYGLVVVCVALSLVQIAGSGSYVLGLHKNGIGASLAGGFVVATELWFVSPDRRRRNWMTVALVIIGVGMFFSLSRGAWMAAGVGVMVILALRRQFQPMFRLGLLAVPVLAVCWASLPEAEQNYIFGFEAERQNVELRLESAAFAWERFTRSPVIGVGVGLREQADATNVVLFTLAETGVLGLAAFGLIHIVFLRRVWRAQKYVPRDDPMYCLLAIGEALLIGRLAHGMVDHYWSRGVLTIAWSAVGMATLAMLTVRARLAAAQPADPNTLPLGQTA